MPAGVRRERRGYEKIECVDIDKRCCFSYLISGICLLILAFLLFQFELPEGVLRGGIIFLVCVFLFPWRHGSERKAGRKKIFGGGS